MSTAAPRIDPPRPAGPFTLRRIDYPAGGRQARHHHAVSSLTLLLTGDIRESAARGEVTGSSLSVVQKPAGMKHANEVGPRGARTLQVVFEPDAGVADHNGVLDHWRWVHGGAPTRPLVRLSRLFDDPAIVDPSRLEECVLEAIAALDGEEASTPGAAPRWLARIKEALDDELEWGTTVQELARRTGAHPVSVSRAFRRHYGVTVTEYRRRERVCRAAQRIVASADSLSRVAHATGHADQPHFCREFQRVAGLTPGEFRRLVG